MEEKNGHGMECGNKIFLFDTDFGKIVVLNCVDFDYEFYEIMKCSSNFIINPRYDIDPDHKFQQISNFQIDRPDGSRSNVFFMHVNASKTKWGDRAAGEGSSIIGNEHYHRIQKYIEWGYRPEDKTKYKLFEARGENLLIAKLNLNNNTERRSKLCRCFNFFNNSWIPIEKCRIWK
jgi:hypothetical protein